MPGDEIAGLAGLALWRGVGRLAGPFLPRYVARRAARGKEEAGRLDERFGGGVPPVGDGPFVWVHAASVGETVAILPLVEAIAAKGVETVLTTGTATAATLVRSRRPPLTTHRYAPLDTPAAIGRFLDRWRPALAVFAETELWPTTIDALYRRGVPLVVANGRLTDRSLRRWRRVPPIARAIGRRITTVCAQSPVHADRFLELGVKDVGTVGNLKYDAPAPAADPALVAAFRAEIGARPVVVAASIHPGEFDAVVSAAAALFDRFPDLLFIGVPRHPERAPDLSALAAARGLAPVLRSSDAAGPGRARFLIADTIGEMGLWYRLASIAFVGGSLVSHGGQNPIEPARLGAAILHGPHVWNFADVYEGLDAAGGAVLVHDGADLAPTVAALLADEASRRGIADGSRAFVESQGGALVRTLEVIAPHLPRASAR